MHRELLIIHVKKSRLSVIVSLSFVTLEILKSHASKSIRFSLLLKMDQLNEIISVKIDERLADGKEDAFYILDLEDVKMKYRKWVEKMPRVVPFFAVKSNNDMRIVKILADMGSSFDCASKAEIKKVLSLGVPPERIIYANTVKQVSELKFAADNHVMRVTFDCSAELLKIKEHHPTAQVVLRIRFDSPLLKFRLGKKFGCNPTLEAPGLIEMCRELDMNLIGVSFHVGSGGKDVEVYKNGLEVARDLFNVGEKFGFKMNFVDIGGGFAGYDMSYLDQYADSINSALEEYFKDPSIMIIAEPGRYFVESAFTLAAQVILKKKTHDKKVHYYVNEGLYMSFQFKFQLTEGNIEFDIIRKSGSVDGGKKVLSNIWGITCSSTDFIIKKVFVPEFEMGDWLVFRNMGAYTTSSATEFNGFKIGEILMLDM